MTSNTGADIAQNIDRLVLNGSRVFGWGWAAHPAKPVSAVHLRVASDGGEVRLPADYGLMRADVEKAFPQLAGARGGVIVFDHNMGGGANQYRERVVKARIAAGDAVILCTYNLPTLDYR